jgi:hypothetical protein
MEFQQCLWSPFLSLLGIPPNFSSQCLMKLLEETTAMCVGPEDFPLTLAHTQLLGSLSKTFTFVFLLAHYSIEKHCSQMIKYSVLRDPTAL